MQCTGTMTDIGIDYKTRKAKVSLILDVQNMENVEQLKNDGKLSIELKKYRKKRSLDANRIFMGFNSRIIKSNGY